MRAFLFRLISPRKLSISAAFILSAFAAANAYTADATGVVGPAMPTATINPERAQQRKDYTSAHAALSQKKMVLYNTLIKELKDYPLLPYLEYQDITSRLSSLPTKDVSRFLNDYPDSLLADRLLNRWLKNLAEKNKWQDYRRFYDPTLSSSELACHSLNARLATKDKTVFDDVAPLWNIESSQVKACDNVFAAWIAAGKLTPELLWERYSKAMNAGNPALAKYLARQMSAPQKKLAELYAEVARAPHTLERTSRFSTQSTQMQEIILHGLKKLARSDAPKALALWQGYDAQQLFSDDERFSTQHHIATRLLRQDHHETAEKLLASTPQITSTDLTESLIRDALRKQDWEKVYQWLVKLPEDAQRTERWDYWLARVMEELDIKEINGRSAQSIYAGVAATRSFYGFLSADKLGFDYRLVDKPMVISPELQLAVEQAPGVQRARELYIMGDIHAANREWFHTTRQMSTEEVVAAGRLADRWGWHRQGIQAMIDARYWDDLQVRFPLAYQEYVAQAAKATSINPLLLYAIARQESSFTPDARSSAGALGLMQLMPATALHTAKRAGIRYNSTSDLLLPEKNIALGSRYLDHLLDQFNGNRILAAAAYNAGPHRVKQWLSKDTAKLPYDVWIETIPFRETRWYVQNVLSFSVIYGYRTGEKQPFITQEEANHSL